MLKHSVKLRRYLRVFCGYVAACQEMARVLRAVQNSTEYNIINFTEYFFVNINITLTMFSASSLVTVEDRNM